MKEDGYKIDFLNCALCGKICKQNLSLPIFCLKTVIEEILSIPKHTFILSK